MVNIVIIGAGDIARKRHIPGILGAPSARLYGFCNRNTAKTAALAETYHVKCFETMEQVYEDDKVDAVLISTPPATHGELALQALRAGRHVLLEKPMTLTVEEAEEICEAAGTSGKKFMMLHVQRFYEPHKKAKELLKNGEIGRLLSYRTFLGNGDADLSGAVRTPGWHDTLFNVGIHRIDLIRYLVEDEIEQVFCHRNVWVAAADEAEGKMADDHMIGILNHKNGVVGTLIATRASYSGEDRSTVLIGTEGTITTYYDGHDVVLEKKNGEKQVYDFSSTTKQKTLEITDIHEQFCRCIEEDREPLVTAGDGVESVRIAAAMEKSDLEKRWVALP